MKVYIVFVSLGGDDGYEIDGVYADKDAADARVPLIEAAEEEFWPEFERQNPGKNVGMVDRSRWAYLGDIHDCIGHVAGVFVSEFEVIEP